MFLGVLLLLSVVTGLGTGGFVHTSKSSYCEYERIQIEWNVSRVADEASVWVGLFEDDASIRPEPMHRWDGDAQLGTLWSQDEEERHCEAAPPPAAPSSALMCDVGGPSCSVAVTHLGWDPSKRQVEIHFDQPTNTPKFELGGSNNNNPLEGVLVLSPRPRLFASAPWWVTSSTLAVPVDLPMDQEAIAHAFADQTATASVVVPAIQPNTPPSSFVDMKGRFKTRIGGGGKVGGGARTFKFALLAETLPTTAATKEEEEGDNGAADDLNAPKGGESLQQESTSSRDRGVAMVTHWSAPFTVKSCEDDTNSEQEQVIMLHNLAAGEGSDSKSGGGGGAGSGGDGKSLVPLAEAALVPFWDARGVFALTGARPLVLPASALPEEGVRSWSFSFWLWIADEPDGNYRTLLFKGPGGSDLDRTPSAWLRPDSMKVAMRASMGDDHPDLGSDSIGELPVRKWCHVVFTFTNRTAASLAAGTSSHDKDDDDQDMLAHPWGYGLFVDGVRDIQINYPEPVAGNTADLRVGKDPERLGPRGFMAHPKLWANALSHKQVRTEYEKTQKSFRDEPMNSQRTKHQKRKHHQKKSRRGEKKMTKDFDSLSAVTAVTMTPRGSALNPLLAHHRHLSKNGDVDGRSSSMDENNKNKNTLRQLCEGGGVGDRPLLSPSLAHLSGLFSFTSSPAVSSSSSLSSAAPLLVGSSSPSLPSSALLTASENDDEKGFTDQDDDDDDEGNDDEGGNDDDDDEGGGDEDDSSTNDDLERVQASEVHFRSGMESLKNCEAPDVRLEAFEVAAKLGHVGAAAAAAGLLLAGEEMLISESDRVEVAASVWSSSCGGKKAPVAAGAGVGSSDDSILTALTSSSPSSSSSTTAATAPSSSSSSSSSPALVPSGSEATARGLLYLQFASTQGACAACARRFAFLTLAGIGAGAFARDTAMLIAQSEEEAIAAAAAAAAATPALVDGGSFSSSSSPPSSSSITSERSHLVATTPSTDVAGRSFLDVRRCSPKLGAAAFDRAHCTHHQQQHNGQLELLSQLHHPSGKAVGLLFSSRIPSMTEVGVGLLHAAAVMDDGEAQLALAHRYKHGLGVELSLEAAAFYYAAAAEKSSSLFHTTGRQPLNEMNRLRDGEETKVGDRERGDDDEELRLLVIQAEEQSHPPSMNELAGLLYWGHRGFAREQERALRLWNGVAVIGEGHDDNRMNGGEDPFAAVSTNARVAAAGMFLKGEGCPDGLANQTRAVELYERAAAAGSVPALNGLGYLYFQGQELPQDLSKAFGYFSEAARLGQDGDSMYNAGHCLANGLGTQVDQKAAVELFERAAFTFGHFDSVYEVGTRHLIGRHPQHDRNVHQALRFLEPSAAGGEWGGKVRQGFDAFLARNPSRAFVLYCEAAELGYEIAQSNAAYLLDRKHLTSPARNLLLLPDDHKHPLAIDDHRQTTHNAQRGDSDDGGDHLSSPHGSSLSSPSSAISISKSAFENACSWVKAKATGLVSASPEGSLIGGEDSGARGADSSISSSISSSSMSSSLSDDSEVSQLWAFHFHRRAAELGNHESFTAIGDAFFYGTGVDSSTASSSFSSGGTGDNSGGGTGDKGGGEANYEGALWWYSKAAQAGSAKGAYSLGYMYERGLGAPASEGRAERHYRKAAELLAAEAKDRQARGLGAGEGWWGGEWYAEVVLACALGALKARRVLRRFGADFLLPPGMF